MNELLAWLDEQCQQARQATRDARAIKDHGIFHASAMARYVALRQARERVTAEENQCLK